MEVSFEAGVSLDAKLLDQFLGREVAARGIVLVERMDGDAGGGGAGGLGKGEAEGVMAFVGDADPVDRTEYDWVAGARDHDTATTQRQVIEALDRIVGHRRTEGRGGVDVEGRYLDRFGEAEGGEGEQGSEETGGVHRRKVSTPPGRAYRRAISSAERARFQTARSSSEPT